MGTFIPSNRSAQKGKENTKFDPGFRERSLSAKRLGIK